MPERKTTTGTQKAQSTVSFTPEGRVSFYRRTTTKGGRWISNDYFAMPLNSYSGGWGDGEAAFREYMESLIGKKEQWSGDLPDVLRDVARALVDDSKEPSRYGAAVGFVRALESMLDWAAQSPELQAKVRRQFDDWATLDAGQRRRNARLDRPFQRTLARIVKGARKARLD